MRAILLTALLLTACVPCHEHPADVRDVFDAGELDAVSNAVCSAECGDMLCCLVHGDAQCTSTQDDAEHCGACDVVCPVGWSCNEGVCRE